jgi:hypothetical protein
MLAARRSVSQEEIIYQLRQFIETILLTNDQEESRGEQILIYKRSN